MIRDAIETPKQRVLLHCPALTAIYFARVTRQPLLLCCAAILVLGFPLASQMDTGCPAKFDYFTGARPISELPRAERSRIVAAISADIAGFCRIGEADPDCGRADKLAAALRFTIVPGGRRGEKLMVIRLVDESCGAHFNCVAFVVKLDSSGATAALKARDKIVPHSAGGTNTLGILRRSESIYPDLLFGAHISATEQAVSCFRWQTGSYVETPCTPECVSSFNQPRNE